MSADGDFCDQSATGAIVEPERPANLGRQLLGDRKTETGAAGLPISGLLQPEERLHGGLEHIVGDSRPAVHDSDDDIVFWAALDADLGGAGKLQRIVYEVRQDAAKGMRLGESGTLNQADDGDCLSDVLVVVGYAVDERGKVNAGIFSPLPCALRA